MSDPLSIKQLSLVPACGVHYIVRNVYNEPCGFRKCQRLPFHDGDHGPVA